MPHSKLPKPVMLLLGPFMAKLDVAPEIQGKELAAAIDRLEAICREAVARIKDVIEDCEFGNIDPLIEPLGHASGDVGYFIPPIQRTKYKAGEDTTWDSNRVGVAIPPADSSWFQFDPRIKEVYGYRFNDPITQHISVEIHIAWLCRKPIGRPLWMPL